MAGLSTRDVWVSKFEIRLADDGDLASVRDLWGQLDRFHHDLGMAFPDIQDADNKWQSSFERTLGRFSFLWIAESNSVIGAFLLARIKQSPAYLGGLQVGEISDLFVAESFRGQQIAAKLVDEAMQKFEGLDLHSVEVQIQAGNDLGTEFWQKKGFDLDLSQVRKMLNGDAK